MEKAISTYNTNVQILKELEVTYDTTNEVDSLIRQKKNSLMDKANEIIMEYDMMVDNFNNIEHNMFGVNLSWTKLYK